MAWNIDYGSPQWSRGSSATLRDALTSSFPYDIDRIISRALAYAIVTGVLIGLYAGLGRVPWIFKAGSCRPVRCLTD
jgi:hypothetical protein